MSCWWEQPNQKKTPYRLQHKHTQSFTQYMTAYMCVCTLRHDLHVGIHVETCIFRGIQLLLATSKLVHSVVLACWYIIVTSLLHNCWRVTNVVFNQRQLTLSQAAPRDNLRFLMSQRPFLLGHLDTDSHSVLNDKVI